MQYNLLHFHQFIFSLNNKVMGSTVKERLKEFIRYKKLSQSSFLELCGLSSGFISGMRVSMLPDKVDSIATNFPELNIAWLLTGSGDMLVKNDGMVSEPAPMYEKRCERCKALEQTIEAQKQTIQAQQELIAELKKGKFTQADSASA